MLRRNAENEILGRNETTGSEVVIMSLENDKLFSRVLPHHPIMNKYSHQEVIVKKNLKKRNGLRETCVS